MLNHTIPYFGEYETIKKIERENNYYIITKYKNNDEELDKWKLFVNEIVTKKLEGEFYGDLEKYLLNN